MAGMDIFKLIPNSQEGIDPGEILVEVGEFSFVTTGTSVEVRTQLATIKGATFTQKVTIGSQDPQDTMISTDGAITSGAITVERPASGASGLTCYYELKGLK